MDLEFNKKNSEAYLEANLNQGYEAQIFNCKLLYLTCSSDEPK